MAHRQHEGISRLYRLSRIALLEGRIDDALDNVRAECPNWPCNDGSLSACELKHRRLLSIT
jgi:hypothetical protein